MPTKTKVCELSFFPLMDGLRRGDKNDHFLRFYTISGASHLLSHLNHHTMHFRNEKSEALKTYMKIWDTFGYLGGLVSGAPDS